MGLAPVGGFCFPAHACVVSEFGTTDVFGRPYPSAGFTSVYILAHQIGHKSVDIPIFLTLNTLFFLNGVTMGLAPVGGVCLPAHACVVSEFGTTDVFGRPYPSAGFTSVYILAHEIGHNLGMHHDGSGNSCARDGFIMSPSRGTNGEATWSMCSAKVVAELQWATCLLDGGDELDTPHELRHDRFGGAPGTIWGAKKQCEILLRDQDAAPSPGSLTAAHCAQLACRSPHRAGFYYAGPALPGTPCGHHMWCQGGECVPSGAGPQPGDFTSQKPPVANNKPGTNNTIQDGVPGSPDRVGQDAPQEPRDSERGEDLALRRLFAKAPRTMSCSVMILRYAARRSA
ncbi:metallo-peptidase family m12B reprolysin-like domain-containing protein [Phthorimaea operculella]|nr:metallo-peptidase family m12B reprolysin-like domain-containing protein [Phthorimaea operculella]